MLSRAHDNHVAALDLERDPLVLELKLRNKELEEKLEMMRSREGAAIYEKIMQERRVSAVSCPGAPVPAPPDEPKTRPRSFNVARQDESRSAPSSPIGDADKGDEEGDGTVTDGAAQSPLCSSRSSQPAPSKPKLSASRAGAVTASEPELQSNTKSSGRANSYAGGSSLPSSGRKQAGMARSAGLPQLCAIPVQHKR
jgi:hypothetical protein